MREEKAGQLSSIDLARRIEGWRDSGKRECRFLIGAADGFDDAERDNADLLIAFGAMTWPHMMARAMLAEQLWRACSILAGHPYHREGRSEEDTSELQSLIPISYADFCLKKKNKEYKNK